MKIEHILSEAKAKIITTATELKAEAAKLLKLSPDKVKKITEYGSTRDKYEEMAETGKTEKKVSLRYGFGDEELMLVKLPDGQKIVIGHWFDDDGGDVADMFVAKDFKLSK